MQELNPQPPLKCPAFLLFQQIFRAFFGGCRFSQFAVGAIVIESNEKKTFGVTEKIAIEYHVVKRNESATRIVRLTRDIKIKTAGL